MRLKYTIPLALMIILLATPAMAGTGVSMAGIELGANVGEFAKRVDMSSAVPVFDMESIYTAKLKPMEGYKSGYLTYGQCADKGKIIKIKLKYQDDSEKFFNKIKDAIEKRYGKHDEWRGNPFRTLLTWKWSIKDDAGKNVSIILMRYIGDDDAFTQGNSIRVSLPAAFVKEQQCAKAKQAGKEKVREAFMPTVPGLDWYLPLGGQ